MYTWQVYDTCSGDRAGSFPPAPGEGTGGKPTGGKPTGGLRHRALTLTLGQPLIVGRRPGDDRPLNDTAFRAFCSSPRRLHEPAALLDEVLLNAVPVARRLLDLLEERGSTGWTKLKSVKPPVLGLLRYDCLHE